MATVRGRARRISDAAERTCSAPPIARSVQRRFARHSAPSTSRAASASASRSSTVPLLPISPAVRSQRPTRKPRSTCAATAPPSPISISSGCGPKTSRSTSLTVSGGVMTPCYPCRRLRASQDRVRRQAEGAEALEQRLGIALLGVLGLHLDTDVAAERRRNLRILERRLIHHHAVLAPGGPHVDEHRLAVAARRGQAVGERGEGAVLGERVGRRRSGAGAEQAER